ncbi:homoserine dehydrogenase [Pseudalkalibacillus salsuginis]|uniref:homoserine dehydrogenase n=1 Tax=Pseudalkalibacillus salsuginis TaxID=2910972 RepID=UPI001EFF4301|nr:homoserine dehydrogenase [Pseudalkalibacillus salsuginis]MCF6409404.1 homoserine dehydrogenase [Pseudalkalibacillus salsuginis]
MATVKVGLLGFGTVGSGVYEIIQNYQERLKSLLGKNVEIAGILVNDITKERGISPDILVTSHFDEILSIPDLDVVIEAIVGIEPGYTYLTKAIDKGCHIITANKELFAHKGRELKQKAQEKNVEISYEASVAGGVPVIGTLHQLLQVNSVVKIEAILNGTSNYILSEIRNKRTAFIDALQSAQAKGYAEADPSNDVDGYDAFYKIVILTELLFGQRPEWKWIERKGVRDISLNHIRLAESFGFRLKHVASLLYKDGALKIDVEPKVVSEEHPLYSVEGVDNAVVITGDLVGQLKLQGPGAGKLPTASAIIEDLVNVFNSVHHAHVKKDVKLLNDIDDQLQTWFVIGNSNDQLDGVILFEESIKDQNELITGRLVKTTGREIKKLKAKDNALTVYPFTGTPAQPAKKAFVSA